MSECTTSLPVVSSLVIQVLPDKLVSVTHRINEFSNAEIYANDGKGKIVVVLEAAHDGELADVMSAIGATDGVITVNMVFHHTEQHTADGVVHDAQ